MKESRKNQIEPESAANLAALLSRYKNMPEDVYSVSLAFIEAEKLLEEIKTGYDTRKEKYYQAELKRLCRQLEREVKIFNV